MWKFFAQVFFELRVRVTHSHCTHAALSHRNQQTAHRRSHNRVVDIHTSTAATVSRRRHSQLFRSVFVETTARVKTRLVQRRRHGITFAHERFEISEPARGEILSRTDPHDALERALQVKHAHTRVRRELGELHCLAVTRVEETTHALHQLHLRIEHTRASRLAAQTSAKAGLFRSFRQIEKAYAFAMCAT